MTIFEYHFADLYLGSQCSWLAGVEGSENPIAVPVDWTSSLSQLRQQCSAKATETGKENFSISFDGINFRVSTLRSLSEVVYVLRRFPKEVPLFNQLGIHSRYVDMLMEPGLTGLVIFAGSFSQGKTTSASAMIKARLSKFGGVCVTFEDPPEMPLEGRHGHGVCYQTWSDQGEFGQAFRQAARWSPTIIFLGEVRDSEAAAEALRASINGRLVICTTHADSVQMAIERMYSLASVNGSSDDVASLLAVGLSAILHQRLEKDAYGALRLKVSFLSMGDPSSHGVRNMIRQRNFTQVGDAVAAQRNRLLAKG